MPRDLPSPELLRQLLRYEPETGLLFWLPRDQSLFVLGRLTREVSCKKWNLRYAGQKAGFTMPGGYTQVSVFKKRLQAHRVIWAMMTGAWPVGELDHVNHDRSDNRFANLRPCDRVQNARNGRSHSDASSSFLGVSFFTRDRRWRSQIRVSNKNLHLGYFDAEIAAARAYDAAAREHFGEFANLNFPDERANQ